VVKTKVASNLVDDLEQTFKALNKFQWKLNPKKCIFGMPSGILLGNIVSPDGIRPNLKKVKVAMKMKPPKCIKDLEANQVHGFSESIHIVARRKGFAILQIPQGKGEVRVVGGS
jgi:hypothetical protein